MNREASPTHASRNWTNKSKVEQSRAEYRKRDKQVSAHSFCRLYTVFLCTNLVRRTQFPCGRTPPVWCPVRQSRWSPWRLAGQSVGATFGSTRRPRPLSWSQCRRKSALRPMSRSLDALDPVHRPNQRCWRPFRQQHSPQHFLCLQWWWWSTMRRRLCQQWSPSLNFSLHSPSPPWWFAAEIERATCRRRPLIQVCPGSAFQCQQQFRRSLLEMRQFRRRCLKRRRRQRQPRPAMATRPAAMPPVRPHDPTLAGSFCDDDVPWRWCQSPLQRTAEPREGNMWKKRKLKSSFQRISMCQDKISKCEKVCPSER